MEVLVAMVILGIAFSTLFGLISGSLKNVDRLREHEKIVRYGQMKLNELVLQVNQRTIPAQLSGSFDNKYRWQARMETVDMGETSASPPGYSIIRLHLSVLWSGRTNDNEFVLETLTWLPKPAET